MVNLWREHPLLVTVFIIILTPCATSTIPTPVLFILIPINVHPTASVTLAIVPSIINAIEEGRVIYDNLKKTIAYSLTHAMPEVGAALWLLWLTCSACYCVHWHCVCAAAAGSIAAARGLCLLQRRCAAC